MGGRVWTPAEDRQIRAAMGRFGELSAVAKRIGRSPGAVRVRAHALRHAPQGIAHGQAQAGPAYPDPTSPGTPDRPATLPSGISAEELERRVNQHIEKLREQAARADRA